VSDRHQILRDEEFWTRLEYDASRWLASSDEKTLRRFWIDGFLPEKVTNTKRGVDVEGIAWVCASSGAQGGRYRFIVSVPQKMLHRRIQTYVIEQVVIGEAEETLHVEIGKDMPSRGSDLRQRNDAKRKG
jgi:hypothetical protein